MTRPPPTGPHSDMDGVNRDMRPGVPNRDPKRGTAADLDRAEKESAARPKEGGKS